MDIHSPKVLRNVYIYILMCKKRCFVEKYLITPVIKYIYYSLFNLCYVILEPYFYNRAPAHWPLPGQYPGYTNIQGLLTCVVNCVTQ